MGRREKRVLLVDGQAASGPGPRLRLARQARGIPLSVMAARLGYSKGHLSAVETGRVRSSPELLAAYERVLELDDGELTPVDDSLAAGLSDRAPRARPNDPGVGRLLARARQGVGYATDVHSPEAVSGHPFPSTSAPRGQAVIRGIEAVLQCATELVEDAAREGNPSGEQILFASVGRAEPFGVQAELSSQWRRALRAALERGWDVVHLCSLDRDEDHPFALVTEMVALIGFVGHYQPYSLPPSASPAAPYGLLVVPGKGAMLLLATRQEHFIDAACFYMDLEHIAVLRDYSELLRSRATPILKIYKGLAHRDGNPLPQPDLLRYDFALTWAEARPGDRLFVKDGLSSQLLPTPHYQELVRRALRTRGDDWTVWIRTLVENRLQRVAALHDQVKSWRFRDLCSKRAIEQLVVEGTYVLDEWLQVPSAAQRRTAVDLAGHRAWATPEERRLQLQAVVDLLRTYPNYDLGLLDDPLASEVTETYWEVKGREGEGTLFLATWYPDGDHRIQVNLEITQPVVVEAFRAYFSSLWERLPPQNREKQHVLAWLQAQIGAIPGISSVGRSTVSDSRSHANVERSMGEASPLPQRPTSDSN